MSAWQNKLRHDPVPPLLSSNDEALIFAVRKDLLEKAAAEPAQKIWKLSAAQKLIARQQQDGHWEYPGGRQHIRSQEDYNQLQTYKTLAILVEKYWLNREHPAIRRAASFLFSCQSKEGDFRGIYQNQYSPNYTAGIVELLVKAGYEKDPRIRRAFKWLLDIRQDDGGWTIPFRTRAMSINKAFANQTPVPPDWSKPFSHCITGVVLRAFAAHPDYRWSSEAKLAGALLKSRFFQSDKYPDRKAAEFWEKLVFPFRFTDILSALDSLSLMQFSATDPQIGIGLDWLIQRQQKSGLWQYCFKKEKDPEIHHWVSLAACRVIKRIFG